MFKIAKIPVSFHPLFWVFASLIGWLNSGSLTGTFIWLIIVILSVLIHELGHAFSALFFKQNVRIDFVALGGLTSYQGKTLKLWQQFIIVFNGPLCGFLLFLFAAFLLNLEIFVNSIVLYFLNVLKLVNLFWSVVNLLPVIPLDGGQLLRIVFEWIWGIKGIKYALFTGMILAGILSFLFFMLQNFIIGAIFFLFAFQSFDSYRKAKFIASSDKDETLRKKIIQAEAFLNSNQKQQAKEILQDILKEKSHGLLYSTAAQYLAFILFDESEIKKAYDILFPIKKQLSAEGLTLLHKIAFLVKDYDLVVELSSKSFQITSTQDVALTNARAFGALRQGKPAGGWLQTAYRIHPFDIQIILSENFFQNIQEDKDFLSFIKQLRKS
jgi:stage IV sporulation protein FB